MNEQELRALAEAKGQGHIFAFWDQLEPSRREALLEQVRRIDFDLMERLCRELLDQSGPKEPVELSPAEIIPLPTTDEERRREDRARERGEELLRAGRVAAFVVAGGQGSRLGLDGPKGAFVIGPVTDRTLFQIHAEKIRALSRRHGRRIPWLVMTSEANHEDTREEFRRRAHFGLDEEDCILFQQGMLPAVDREGRFLLESRSRVFTAPNGHGGSIQAIHDSGALEALRSRGIDTIFYFQVDNPLVSICDPVFLGHHDLAAAEMSSKVVRKRDWREKVGVIGRRDGRLTVLEYSDLPEDDARATLPDGSLKYWAGSVAIHVLSVDFIAKLNRGGFQLPFHRAEKSVPHVDTSGEPRQPEGKNGVKFETFVFDALEAASRSVTVEARREEEFSPVKNAEGEDSPGTARRDLTEQALRWLEACGAEIEREADGSFRGHVEISPLTALDREELARHVRPGTPVRPGFHV